MAEAALSRTTSALIVGGERSLAAEFPEEAQAKLVLAAIGSGESTFTSITRSLGGIPGGSLQRALAILTNQRIVAAELPLSTKPSRETRYRVADPYLRFWLRFVGPNLPLLERGRSDIVLERVSRDWEPWRGRAIEPVIRESLLRAKGSRVIDETAVIGGYWTRTNATEIDLVGADRSPVANRINFIGSIKWRERSPFGRRDLTELLKHRAVLPGAKDSTELMAVSRTRGTVPGVTVFGPPELMAAWKPK